MSRVFVPHPKEPNVFQVFMPRYSRSWQDIRDEIQDVTKKFKMSRQNLRFFQDIQEFKIFPRSWQDILDVERWAALCNEEQF